MTIQSSFMSYGTKNVGEWRGRKKAGPVRDFKKTKNERTLYWPKQYISE